MTPEELGPYKIERVLGTGGMGTVYAAVDKQSGERAAVKVLTSGYAQEGQLRSRFEAEIKTLTTLHHPNIVRIHGYGEADGQLYYSMELIEGRSLQEHLKEAERVPWRQVVQIGIELCAALKHAHERGVIHRDLKPANIILDQEGRIKLADFGIARVFGSAQMTADGALVGTPHYMAPEQATDEVPITQRTDLYSLGCVFYALLTGGPPFQGSSSLAVMQAHCSEKPVPVKFRVPAVPVEFERLIMRLLSKEPRERLGTAHAVAVRLKELETASDADQPAASAAAGTANDATLVHTSANSDDDSDVELTLADETAGVVPPASPQAKQSFTVVQSQSPESSDEVLAPGEDTTSVVTLIAALLALAIFVGLGFMFWPRTTQPTYLPPPPLRTADDLHGSIVGSKLPLSGAKLGALQKTIDEFRRRFPGDDRQDEVNGVARDVAYYQFVHKLPSREIETLSELEAACQSALKTRRDDPDTALAMFRRLAAAEHEGGDAEAAPAADRPAATEVESESSATRQHCLRLVNHQITKIQDAIDQAYDRLIERVGDEPSITDWISGEQELREFLEKYPSDERCTQLQEAVARIDYREIERLVGDGSSAQRLVAADWKIRAFAENHPGHERIAKLQEYLARIDVETYPRRIESRARNDKESLSQLESVFLTTMRLVDEEPGKAYQMFGKLAAAGRTAANVSLESKLCLASVNDQLAKIEQMIDARYEGIKTAEEEGLSALVAAKDDLRYFVEHFHFDDRYREVAACLKRVDVNLLPETLTHLAARHEQLLPVQQIYLEALHLAEKEKAAAADKFQSLIDLFGQNPEASYDDLLCVASAQQKLAELQDEIERFRANHILAIEGSLDRLDDVRAASLPRAVALAEAVIDLYGDKPWAGVQVDRARAALATLQERSGLGGGSGTE